MFWPRARFNRAMICGARQLQLHGGGRGAAERQRAAREFYGGGAGAEIGARELDQSASSWAAAGARRRKAGRTSGPTNPAMPRGA